MGMRVIWVAFGGAVAYLLAAVAVPVVIVALRGRGVDISDEQAASITTISAIWATGIGAYLGWRRIRSIEARRQEN